MKYLERAALLFVTVVAMLSAMLPAAEEGESPKYNQMEVLYGFEMLTNGIAIDVIGTGCTSERNFFVEWRLTPDGYDLSIVKRTPDRCRRAPMMQRVMIELDPTAKNDQLRVMNPLKLKP